MLTSSFSKFVLATITFCAIALPLSAQTLDSSDLSKPVFSHKTDLKAKLIPGYSNIRDASGYKLLGDLKNYNIIDMAEAIGKLIRQDYYSRSYQVDGYSYKAITVKEALELLSTSDGEFRKFSEADLKAVQEWITLNDAYDVVLMNLQTNYHSGTGLENNLIFIPTDRKQAILTINRFFYSE